MDDALIDRITAYAVAKSVPFGQAVRMLVVQSLDRKA
jgi:hypothetical protein